MKCKNTNGEILRRVHRQHCKNYRFIARTSGEQQYDDDRVTIDTRVQLQTSRVIRFFTACGETAAAIHKNLVSVYSVQCMSEGVVRQWVRISIWEETKCMKYCERETGRLINIRHDRRCS